MTANSNRRTFLKTTAAAGASVAFGVPLLAKASAKIELKMGTVAPANSSYASGIRWLFSEIAKQTDGAVKGKLYAATMGDEPAMIRKMRSGQLDAAAITAVGMSLINKQMLVGQLPLVMKNDAEVDRFHKGMQPVFAGLLEKEGFKLGGLTDVGFVYLFYKGSPVKNPSDIASLKLSTLPEDHVMKETLRLIGSVPTSLDIGEILAALQTGMLNAFLSPPYAALALQWAQKDYVNSLLNLKLASLTGGAVISLKTWEKIPDAERQVIERLSTEMTAKLTRRIRADNAKASKALVKAGIAVTEPSNFAEWKAIADKVRANLTGKLLTPDLVDTMMSLVKG